MGIAWPLALLLGDNSFASSRACQSAEIRILTNAATGFDTRKFLKICVAHLMPFDTFPRS
jgi:hypothetical protein